MDKKKQVAKRKLYFKDKKNPGKRKGLIRINPNMN